MRPAVYSAQVNDSCCQTKEFDLFAVESQGQIQVLQCQVPLQGQTLPLGGTHTPSFHQQQEQVVLEQEPPAVMVSREASHHSAQAQSVEVDLGALHLKTHCPMNPFELSVIASHDVDARPPEGHQSHVGDGLAHHP